MVREESNDENIYRCKFIVKLVELHFKGRKITIDRIGEKRENIRLRLWNDTGNPTKGQNGYEWQRTPKERPRNNNTGLGKVKNKKQPGSVGEQQTFRNRLKEDLHIT
jgi:hypothetical protein